MDEIEYLPSGLARKLKKIGFPMTTTEQLFQKFEDMATKEAFTKEVYDKRMENIRGALQRQQEGEKRQSEHVRKDNERISAAFDEIREAREEIEKNQDAIAVGKATKTLINFLASAIEYHHNE